MRSGHTNATWLSHVLVPRAETEQKSRNDELPDKFAAMRVDAAPVEVTAPEAQRLAALFPSFRDFVDAALFDPCCGYYSTGQVRFGYGGHYDTFPLALAPFFGRMVAQYGFRFWRRAGEPQRFEICELGAGNGQLCLDVLVTVAERARQEVPWSRFARSLRYRIIERSPALIARQQQQLGPLARRVRWTNRDLAQNAPRRLPLGACGIVVANEVLDCLSHHQIVSRRDTTPGVVFVIPVLRRAADAPPGVELVPGLRPRQWAVPAAHLPAVLADEGLRRRLRFTEAALPLEVVPGLEDFLRRHYPEFFCGRRFRPYFACPGDRDPGGSGGAPVRPRRDPVDRLRRRARLPSADVAGPANLCGAATLGSQRLSRAGVG